MKVTSVFPTPAPLVTIYDQPCGSGKTTQLLRSFDKGKRYLVIVPLLSEVERVKTSANMAFASPERSEIHETKREAIVELLAEGKNIVATHALFSDLKDIAKAGYLQGYELFIDEVPEVVQQVKGPKKDSWNNIYIGAGYVDVDQSTGLVSPTQKWRVNPEAVDDALNLRLFCLAQSGCLYVLDESFFVWALPTELLTCVNSVAIYTYLAEGSLLLPYLRKISVQYKHVKDFAKDKEYRKRARELISIQDIPSLSKLQLNHSVQTAKQHDRYYRKVSSALKNLAQRQLRNIHLEEVLITCAKCNWSLGDGSKTKAGAFARNSRMFGKVKWIPNTTRGTNDYISCRTAIYLYDQNPNPFLVRWLGVEDQHSFAQLYAATELVQWLYRTAVRRGEKITVYIPSKRMRQLLKGWLNDEDHPSLTQLAA